MKGEKSLIKEKIMWKICILLLSVMKTAIACFLCTLVKLWHKHKNKRNFEANIFSAKLLFGSGQMIKKRKYKSNLF